jgi:hypothetical protein
MDVSSSGALGISQKQVVYQMSYHAKFQGELKSVATSTSRATTYGFISCTKTPGVRFKDQGKERSMKAYFVVFGLLIYVAVDFV